MFSPIRNLTVMGISMTTLGSSLSQGSGLDGNKTHVRILVDESGKTPFGQHTSMASLSFFNIHVLGQLLQVSDSLEIEQGLIEKAEFFFDRKEYLLKLRSGLRFHNGRIADSKDLEFSLLRGFFSSTPSLFKLYLGGIEGIEKATIGKFTSGAVTGVRIVDSLTIAVKLKHPNPSFLHSLTEPYFSLVPREALDKSYLIWKENPIGVGPYRVKSKFKEGLLQLEKVDISSPGPDLVDLLTTDSQSNYEFSLVKSNKIQNSKTEFSKKAGAIQTIHFSRLNPLSQNVDFRKALAYAFDRNSLAKSLPGSTPGWEMLPSQFWGRTGEKKNPDIEKAKQFVSKIPVTLRNQTWKLQVFNGPKQPEPLIVEMLSQLKSIGLSFEYFPGTEKFRSIKTATEIPLFTSGRVANFIDPLITFAAYLPTGPDPYLTFESDPAFEAAYAKATESVSRESRIETIQDLSRQLNDKFVCIPLLERRVPIQYDSKKIKNVDVIGNLGLFKLQDVEFSR